jgi:hypothetical protein
MGLRRKMKVRLPGSLTGRRIRRSTEQYYERGMHAVTSISHDANTSPFASQQLALGGVSGGGCNRAGACAEFSWRDAVARAEGAAKMG